MIHRIAAGLLAAALLWTVPAHAWLAQGGATVTPTRQVFMAGTLSGVTNSSDTFIPVNYAIGTASATEEMYSLFPAPGTLTRMRVKVNGTAPTGIQTWTLTLRKTGTTDTALSCTISSSDSGVCAVTANVAFAAGDWGAVKIHPANSPTTARLQVSFDFQPTTANDTIISSWANGFSNSAAQVQLPMTSNASLGVPSVRRWVTLPADGALSKLYVKSNAPGAEGSGKSYTYAIGKNGAASAVTTTLTEVETADSDTSNSVAIIGPVGTTAGDDVEFFATPANTPTSAIAALAMRYLPTSCPGCFPLIQSGGNTVGTSTSYCPMTGAATGCVTTESQTQLRGLSMTITKMTVNLQTAPGAGTSRTIMLRVNGADSSPALSCTIADTDKVCVATGSLAISDDDILSTKVSVSGATVSTVMSIAYLAQ